MPQAADEKTLSGDMEIEIVERFDQQVGELKLVKKALLRSLALWWLALPEDQQKAVYFQGETYDFDALILDRIKCYLGSPTGAAQIAEIILEIGEDQLRKKRRKP